MKYRSANIDEKGMLFGKWCSMPGVWTLTNRWQNFMFLIVGEEKAMLIDTGYGEGNLREIVELSLIHIYLGDRAAGGLGLIAPGSVVGARARLRTAAVAALRAGVMITGVRLGTAGFGGGTRGRFVAIVIQIVIMIGHNLTPLFLIFMTGAPGPVLPGPFFSLRLLV